MNLLLSIIAGFFGYCFFIVGNLILFNVIDYFYLFNSSNRIIGGILIGISLLIFSIFSRNPHKKLIGFFDFDCGCLGLSMLMLGITALIFSSDKVAGVILIGFIALSPFFFFLKLTKKDKERIKRQEDLAKIRSSLNDALEKCNYDNVVNLLENGANVDTRDDEKRTLLHRTIGLCLTEPVDKVYNLASYLLNHGAEVNAKDKEGRTPLFFLAEKYTEKLFKLLLDKGANINARDSKRITPLHVAVENHQVLFVKHLLSQRADTEAMDDLGKTPLDWALREIAKKEKYLVIARRDREINVGGNFDASDILRANFAGYAADIYCQSIQDLKQIIYILNCNLNRFAPPARKSSSTETLIHIIASKDVFAINGRGVVIFTDKLISMGDVLELRHHDCPTHMFTAEKVGRDKHGRYGVLVPQITVNDVPDGTKVWLIKKFSMSSPHPVGSKIEQCPRGHGPLKIWNGESRCWTCGYPEK